MNQVNKGQIGELVHTWRKRAERKVQKQLRKTQKQKRQKKNKNKNKNKKEREQTRKVTKGKEKKKKQQTKRLNQANKGQSGVLQIWRENKLIQIDLIVFNNNSARSI